MIRLLVAVALGGSVLTGAPALAGSDLVASWFATVERQLAAAVGDPLRRG